MLNVTQQFTFSTMKNNYSVSGDEAHILMNTGTVCVIDLADLNVVSRFTWHCFTPAPKAANPTWYARSSILGPKGRRSLVYMHRLILGAPKGMSVDHINHNGLDNRRRNLRLCSHKENMENRDGANANSTTGLRGIYVHHSKDTKGITRTYWNCRVMSNGKSNTKNFPFTDEGLERAKQTVEQMRRSILTHA